MAHDEAVHDAHPELKGSEIAKAESLCPRKYLYFAGGLIALMGAIAGVRYFASRSSATSVAEGERVEQARESEKFFISTADPIELRLAGKVEDTIELSYGEWSRKVSIAEANAHFYFQTVPREIGVAIWVDGESTPRIYGSKDVIRLPERPVRGYRFKLVSSSDKGSLRVWIKPDK